jgi:hypothetical protein
MKTAPTIVPSGPGWCVVTAVRDAATHKPLRLSEEPVIAWGIEAELGELPDGTARCMSKAWPITAGQKVRFDDDRWGLKKPDGTYEYADYTGMSASGCLAGFEEVWHHEEKGPKHGSG